MIQIISVIFKLCFAESKNFIKENLRDRIVDEAT